MSKIYEALQRAEQMRGSSSEHIREPILSTSAVTDDSAAVKPPRIAFAARPWNPNSASIPALEEAGPLLEQFRTLRSRLYESQSEAPLKVIVISSGSPLEGKTFISVNLAITLARNSERNVLLIDGDMRRPSAHRLLGVSNDPGLSDYLKGHADVGSVISRGPQVVQNAGIGSVSLANLSFIPGGSTATDSSELINNSRFEELIASVSSAFDWILIDSPPVSVVSDAVDLARTADGVLLVMRQGTSNIRIVQQTRSAFSKNRVIGFVFNDADKATKSYYSYYAPDSSSTRASRSQA